MNEEIRLPASKARVVLETAAAGTPLAILVGYGIQQVWTGAPAAVQAAATAVSLGFLSAAFSWLRDSGFGGWFTGAK